MPESNQTTYLWSVVTLLLALLLQILPLSEPLVYWRPQFVLLLVFYWLFRSPFKHGIAFAWLAGLSLDIFIGELFGRHAVVFALSAYLLQLLQQRLHHFRVIHQAVLVLVLVLTSQLLLHSITLLLRANWQGDLVVMPAVTSAVIWPLLVWLLNRLIAPQPSQNMSANH
ncbi:MAG: rod shape-determining protein MreD [Porticoccus sp.]|nr:rod shape-determining protein MreD [Porticoccus sp.]MBQ0808555.1 rod shape-determining protein MreD [Porticoccus sp.]